MSDTAFHRLHSSYSHPVLQHWAANCNGFSAATFVYPVFVSDNPSANEEISSLPNQRRVGVDHIVQYLAEPVANGLKSVLLFPVITNDDNKDSIGSASINKNLSPLPAALQTLRQHYPNLLLCCDVCLCAYTDHGHCGLLTADARIDTAASARRIGEAAVMLATAGADVVAPSDMMDCRVAEIKKLLWDAGLGSRVAVMSYSCKFASGFYGPFRDAAKSAPSSGDRSTYQLPYRSAQLALRAANRDVLEGADMLMVKPGTAYLDIVRQVRDRFPNHPLAIYHVSGEWAMIWHAAAAGAIDLQKVTVEVFGSMLRAGSNIIISYATPLMLQWIKRGDIW